jgi:hypothetical protein
MKQYTNQDQTAKLIELGFPESETSRDYDLDVDKSLVNCAYSIGELIEFLPKTIEENEVVFSRVIDVESIAYYSWELEVYFYKIFEAEELIDSLFKACVTLKKEGVI